MSYLINMMYLRVVCTGKKNRARFQIGTTQAHILIYYIEFI